MVSRAGLAVVRPLRKARFGWATLPAVLLTLAGCTSIYIDLDGYYEGGELWFDDPNRSWFNRHCVRAVSVTWLDEKADRQEAMWEADSSGHDCITTAPFRYGRTELPPDRAGFVPPRPLVPGVRYEIFVELDNGAGSGFFSITDDGQVINAD